jgi:hypothetical protein
MFRDELVASNPMIRTVVVDEDDSRGSHGGGLGAGGADDVSESLGKVHLYGAPTYCAPPELSITSPESRARPATVVIDEGIVL